MGAYFVKSRSIYFDVCRWFIENTLTLTHTCAHHYLLLCCFDHLCVIAPSKNRGASLL